MNSSPKVKDLRNKIFSFLKPQKITKMKSFTTSMNLIYEAQNFQSKINISPSFVNHITEKEVAVFVH